MTTKEDKAAGVALAELNGWQPPCSRDPDCVFSSRGYTITHNDPLEFRQLPSVRRTYRRTRSARRRTAGCVKRIFRIICEDEKLDIRESDTKDKEFGWVFEPDRQIALLKNFWGKLEKDKSLMFLYCNHGNPSMKA
jgi:exodeoxyribonuclease V alpha subunit